jgi:hypothetical protein
MLVRDRRTSSANGRVFMIFPVWKKCDRIEERLALAIVPQQRQCQNTGLCHRLRWHRSILPVVVRVALNYFFFSLATSRAVQEISIVYALTALAIPVCAITVENIRQRLRRASPVIRCRPIVLPATTGGVTGLGLRSSAHPFGRLVAPAFC